MRPQESGFRPTLITAAAIGVATLVRWLLVPVLPVQVPFITYFPVIAVATWYGGRWMGVAATLLCYLIADYLFIPPIYGFAILEGKTDSIVQCVTFFVMCGLIIGLTESLFRSHERVAEFAAQAARERQILKVSLRSIGDGVIATDAKGLVTFLNPVAEALTGWTQQAAQGRPLHEIFRIVNERTRLPVEDPAAKVLRTGRVLGLANHTVLIARDGPERPIDDSAAPIQDDSGQIHGVILVFRDATERRRAFEAAQRLASIIESSEDAIIGTSIDGTITSWNAAAERMYGYTAAEVIGRNIELIVPEDRRSEMKSLIQEVSAGNEIPDVDTVRQRKDGSRVDVSLQMSPITNAYGEVIGTSKIDRDITSRKARDASLQFLAETSATLGGLTDQSSALQQAARTMVPFLADWCVIFLVNQEGEIEFRACAHGDPEIEALLEKMLAVFPFDWNSPGASVEALRTGTTQLVSEVSQEAFQRFALDAEQREMLQKLNPRSVISAPLQVRGETLGTISFVSSDSNRRYTAQDVTLAEDLARRVATAMDNARLLSSLRVADRQKNEFLAMLAHELRNPLAAIQYAAEIADSDVSFLEIIKRQVQQLTHMIDDLLDLSRISRNKIQLRKQNIDAATIARRTAATLRPLVEERNHQLILDLDDQPLPLHVDATRIEQAVGNLLTNSAKYTPEGGQITLSTRSEDGDVVIRVHDTGIGIAADVLPFVFDLFAQAESTLDRSKGGLGIGLSVARQLVELHGGTVTARSSGVGHGSEFSVRLPMAEMLTEGEDAEPSYTQERVTPLRVLIVEDNHDTARTEAALLKLHGHQVMIAFDGLNGLEQALHQQPDAMVVDIGLPGLNGYELAMRVRQSGCNAILIAVSGYGQSVDQERSYAAGFDAHLVKPVTSEALLSELKRCHHSRNGQRV